MFIDSMVNGIPQLLEERNVESPEVAVIAENVRIYKHFVPTGLYDLKARHDLLI